MITRLTSLSKNIVQFCRFLRQKGFTVTVEEEATALQALQHIDYGNNQVFFLALQAVFCRSKTQLDEFKNLFNEYWKRLDSAADAKLKNEETKQPPIAQPQLKSLKAWLYGNKNKETEETASYSVNENLSQKDFSAVPEDEVDELMQTVKSIAKRLAAKTNRRYESSHKIDLPDLRKTLRKNLRRGGELLDIIHRRPKRNRVKLVLLCDVSRSMELYSAFFIQFMYAFQQVFRRMETFVFSTSLKRITFLLKQKNFDEAIRLLTSENSGWSGGTRIGEALNVFTNDYGKKMLGSKTIVIIVSDGWDTGNIDLIKKSMEFIYAKSKKVIWLNPLAGFEDYKPDVSGMKAAMPFIDVFAPVHNAESLKRLEKWL
ncbi:MAG: VWA domain-containing protein [Bacteroidetes bacterium]|nr:MAG: VWA domain-containing protein [Bacteroidota bacterium]